MTYELVTCSDGSHTLKDPRSGNWMHSRVGPAEEARRIYLDPSRVAERLQESSTDPLVIWDVGLGIAGNALAAIELSESARRPLQIISFESRLDGIQQALADRSHFPSIEKHAPKLEALLAWGEWHGWKLLVGDFRQTVRQAPAPDLIWWDFYSPSTCPELWSVDTFRIAFEAAQAKADAVRPTELFTYSAATPVRLALLLAGFHVGYGAQTPAKNESTMASTRRQSLPRPLGPEWLVKLAISSRPRPWGECNLSPDEVTAMVTERLRVSTDPLASR